MARMSPCPGATHNRRHGALLDFARASRGCGPRVRQTTRFGRCSKGRPGRADPARRHRRLALAIRPDSSSTIARTQRNLVGRRAPTRRERLGAAFRRYGVPVARVLSSPWCRCLETARIAFGVEPAMRRQRFRTCSTTRQNRDSQLAAFRKLVAARAEARQPLPRHARLHHRGLHGHQSRRRRKW